MRIKARRGEECSTTEEQINPIDRGKEVSYTLYSNWHFSCPVENRTRLMENDNYIFGLARIFTSRCLQRRVKVLVWTKGSCLSLKRRGGGGEFGHPHLDVGRRADVVLMFRQRQIGRWRRRRQQVLSKCCPSAGPLDGRWNGLLLFVNVLNWSGVIHGKATMELWNDMVMVQFVGFEFNVMLSE